jgi:hypothetical protein
LVKSEMNSCVAVETPSTAAAQYIHCILTGETDSDFCRTLTYGSDTAGCVVAGPPVGHIPSCVLRRLIANHRHLAIFEGDQLRRAELLYVGALTTAGIAAHLSHVPIAFGLILLCMGLKPIFAPNQIRIRQSTALLWIPFVVAVCFMLAETWVESAQSALRGTATSFFWRNGSMKGPPCLT